MATVEQLKALLESHASGDDERFRTIALQIAAHAARRGKTELAEELRAMVDKARRQSTVSVSRPVPILSLLQRTWLSSLPEVF